MPSLTIANGHDAVSGLSFRKMTSRDDSMNNGRSFENSVEPSRPQEVNGISGTNHHPTEGSDKPTVEALRLRLKKGRVAANRNGGVYDNRPGLPFYNNNGPLKAFPMNNNTSLNDTHDEISKNMNNSSLPNSESDISSLTSSSNRSSPGEQTKIPNSRPPLQRINGRGHLKQNLPPGLTDPSLHSDCEEKKNTLQKTEDIPRELVVTEDINPSSSASPPLKSALVKYEQRKKNVNFRTNKEAVSFAGRRLPPGMLDIQKELFIPGTKACFQHEIDLPLLVSTDAAILRRRSSITPARRNRLNNSSPNTKKSKPSPRVAEDASAMLRSRSSASEISLQPDMQILKTCWNIILSFMGDDKHSLAKNHRSIGSLVSQKRKKIWRKSSGDLGPHRPAILPAASTGDENVPARPSSMFVHDNPDLAERPKKVPSQPQSPVPKPKNISSSVTTLTVLDKVHFLVNSGLKLPHLQDEIYCMIIKQLINNPSKYSSALGWILLALVAGSFAPTEKILDHVHTFFDHHQHAWSKYCGERLERTVINGPRTNPPSSLEIQAAKTTERILFPVICMDNSAMTVTVDSATTSKEILESMASKNRIGDSFGYCIVLQSGDKIINLGAGRFPIMDALSQVEMYHGKKFAKTTCRLYYRRDIFSPRDLFCCDDDSMALRLTFFQVCGGVRTGEYYCKQAPDLSLLIAHQYCIQFGVENVDDKRVAKFCEKCLPYDVYKTDKKNWCRVVRNTINALRRKQGPIVDPTDIMAQVVRYTMQNLNQHFVRTYSILTFNKVGGVCTYTSDLSLSLSHEGVIVRQGDAIKVTNNETEETPEVVTVPVVLLEIPATSLKKVKLDTNEAKTGTTLTISDIIGGSYEITSAHGPEIYAVLFRYIRDISTGANKESRA